MNKHLAQIHSIPVTTVHQPVYLEPSYLLRRTGNTGVDRGVDHAVDR